MVYGGFLVHINHLSELKRRLIVTSEAFIEQLRQYEATFSGVLSRFKHTRDSVHIDSNDNSKYRQYIQEVFDLLNDKLGPNQYSASIARLANEGVNNFTHSPSFKSVEDILSVLRAAITRIRRNPDIIVRQRVEPQQNLDQLWLLLHPNVVALARPRFDAGHYADAVEAVLKELNSLVKRIHKDIAGEELDGAALMRKAFTPNRPTIILDDLGTETGRNIQQGHMDLFAGAMVGVRNPKAHGNVVITPERAIHHFFLASLLFYKLDERVNLLDP
jgi:uncharacterized protein (TIGR02391 family)